MDPARMADVAFQLAEGERILMRPHRAVSTDEVIKKAIRVATEKKDKATLERLAKLAEARASDELKAQVAAAQKLADEQRAEDPAVLVSIGELTPQQYALYRDSLLKVKRAQLTGDRRLLEEFGGQMPLMQNLPEKQREHLEKIMDASRSGLPEEADTTTTMLGKLAEQSREYRHRRHYYPHHPHGDVGPQIAAGILQIIAGALNAAGGGGYGGDMDGGGYGGDMSGGNTGGGVSSPKGSGTRPLSNSTRLRPAARPGPRRWRPSTVR